MKGARKWIAEGKEGRKGSSKGSRRPRQSQANAPKIDFSWILLI
jgi:hypothetical protein